MRKAWRWTKRVGLALLLAAAVLCVVSEFQFPAVVAYRPQGPHYLVWLVQHTVYVERTPGRVAFGTGVAEGGWTMSGNITSPATVGGLRLWWPQVLRNTIANRPGTSIRLPVWPVYLLALFCLALWFRSRRTMPGHCTTCRYDLRGLPKDAAACPECGAGIAGAKSAGGEA